MGDIKMYGHGITDILIDASGMSGEIATRISGKDELVRIIISLAVFPFCLPVSIGYNIYDVFCIEPRNKKWYDAYRKHKNAEKSR